MSRYLTIALLCAALVQLAGCTTPPPPQHAELLDPNAAYPNLADVPPRPPTMPPSEREQIRQELSHDNKAMQADIAQ